MPAKKNAKIYFQKIASILKLDFLVFKITRRIPSLGSSEVIEQLNSMDLLVLLTIFLDDFFGLADFRHSKVDLSQRKFWIEP